MLVYQVVMNACPACVTPLELAMMIFIETDLAAAGATHRPTADAHMCQDLDFAPADLALRAYMNLACCFMSSNKLMCSMLRALTTHSRQRFGTCSGVFEFF